MTESTASSSVPEGYVVLRDNGLALELGESGLEEVWEYSAGGLHPVHLGDLLQQRYKVIHKLGNGGFANVWLCSDTWAEMNRYVAVKILVARSSGKETAELRVNELRDANVAVGLELFSFPLDQFEIEGPNGIHLALVYPVLGPDLKVYRNKISRDAGRVIRTLCLQATRAVASLHTQGICHGDVRASNMLLQVTGLDHLSEDGILKLFGQPVKNPVLDSETREPHTQLTAPQYLIYPVDWRNIDTSHLTSSLYTSQMSLIDFGGSFPIHDPPREFSLPPSWCGPEYHLEHTIGVESDLWALGCTLFEIRTGQMLLAMHTDDTVDEFLSTICRRLGKLPEPWWSTTWKARPKYFEDELDTEGNLVEIPDELRRQSSEREDGSQAGDGISVSSRGVVAQESGSRGGSQEEEQDSVGNPKPPHVQAAANADSNTKPEANPSEIRTRIGTGADTEINTEAASSPLPLPRIPALAPPPSPSTASSPPPRRPTPHHSTLEVMTRNLLTSRDFRDEPSSPANDNDNDEEKEAALLIDLLRKLLRYEPEERISAKGAAEHAWFRL